MSVEVGAIAPQPVLTPNEAANAPADKPIDAVIEGQEGGEPGLETQKPEEKKGNKRKLKFKVDGKEIEEEVDFDNEEYMTKQLQMAKAAQKRMSEYSQLQKDVQQFLQDLKTNPKKVLADPRIGLDVKQLAAEIIEEEIRNSQKSPEQIQKETLEGELKSLKEEREKEKAEFQTKEMQRLQQQEFQRYDTLMSKALEKSDLPKSPYIIKKMADYMLMGLQENLDVTPEDVIPLVRDEMVNDLKEMFAVMPEDVIEAIIGKDVITKLRKRNVAKAKAAPPTPLKSQLQDSGKKTETKEEKKERIKMSDFFGF